MFLESDRVQIRLYLGFAALYLQADPRLESAITAIQSIADGGTRPDSSSETQVRAILTVLQGVDASLATQDTLIGTTSADEVKLGPVHETMRLRAHGRMWVHRLARMLDTRPRADIFSAAEDVGDDPPHDRSWASVR